MQLAFRFLVGFFLLSSFLLEGVDSLYAQLSAPSWSCIATNGNDVQLTWQAVNDPGNNFVKYEIHTLQDGKIGENTAINTTSYTHVGVNTVKDYFITAIGNLDTSSSVVLKNIRLAVNNPSNGTALLNWNHMGDPNFLPPGQGAILSLIHI